MRRVTRGKFRAAASSATQTPIRSLGSETGGKARLSAHWPAKSPDQACPCPLHVFTHASGVREPGPRRTRFPRGLPQGPTAQQWHRNRTGPPTLSSPAPPNPKPRSMPPGLIVAPELPGCKFCTALALSGLVPGHTEHPGPQQPAPHGLTSKSVSLDPASPFPLQNCHLPHSQHGRERESGLCPCRALPTPHPPCPRSGSPVPRFYPKPLLKPFTRSGPGRGSARREVGQAARLT